MKSRFLRLFRREIVRTEKFDLGSTESEPRLVRKPAKRFLRTRRPQRSESLSDAAGGGGGGGGSRRRRPTHYAPFAASRLSRLGRQLSQAVDDGDAAKVRVILESVGDVDDLEEEVDGMLLSACENKDLATVAVLLRYGASPNALQGQRGDCGPLHVAVRRNCLGIASLLLSHGSHPNIGTKFERRTPLHLASSLGSGEMVGFLLENGARVDQADIYGSTPLHAAARMGHVTVAKALLDGGAGVDAYNNDGWTALHLAAQSGNIAVVRLLVERNAFVDAQTRFGRTPLQWAATCGHLQVVEVLLGQRAKPTVEDVNGKTAVDHAANERIRAALVRAMGTEGASEGASVEGKGRARASTIGRLVNIDARSRKELCSSGHISRQTLAEEEQEEGKDEEEERRRGRGEGENRLRRRRLEDGVAASVLKQDLMSGLRHSECRHYSSSWTDCRSVDADSGRGSSRDSSSVSGTLNRSIRDGGSLARYSELRGTAGSAAGVLDGCRDQRWTGVDWDGDCCSLEHLAAVPEAAAADEDARKREAEEEEEEERSLGRCRSQLRKLRDAFRLRTLTLERGMGKIVRETDSALDDGSLRSATDALRSTRSAVQSLQSVVDEFRIQFDARLSLAERDISSASTDEVPSPPVDPFHVFFHFLVSHVARYVDGWRRLIQGLCLPIDRECEVLRGVTRAAAAAAESEGGPRRLSRSTGDMAGPLGDRDGGLVVDLSVAAVGCVRRHLSEVCGVKKVVRRILELMNFVFEDDSFRIILRNFVRLVSSIDANADVSADVVDDYCAMVVKVLGQSPTFSASELSTRLLPSISPADPSGHDATGASVADVLATWKRTVAKGVGCSLVDRITDLLVALVDLGREDLASRYCQFHAVDSGAK